MTHFKVTISGGDNPIELGAQVKKVETFMDTINNDTQSKSGGMLAKLEISGDIRSQDSAIFVELFKWAKDFKDKTQYRKVEVEVGAAEDSIFRRYEYDKMFVVDYKETYVGEGREHGSFILNLTQQDDNWGGVESFPQ